jgi:hypothetical protein
VLRGCAGAAACGLVIGAVAVPVTGVWPGTKQTSVPPQIVGMPDDSGLALMAPGTTATVTTQKKKKAAHHAWEVQAAGTQIVVRPSEGTVPATDSTPVVPNDTAAAKTPAKTKKPKPVAGHEVVTSSDPLPTTTIVPTPAAANSLAGLVRLSVRSAGVAANANGDPELQVKLGIAGGQPSDALPETVTLHLRPTVPAALPKDDPTLALKATVDMVDAPRTTATDPALRMRVRMNIAQAPTGTPMVQEPSTGGDGKSNVIALTVGLANFQAPGDEPGQGTPGAPDPGQPSQPGDPTGSPSGPGGPTTPGDSGPGTPAPSDPAPTEPAYPTPAPSDPTPAPSDPAPTPAPSDPTPAPAPSDPAPTPAPSDPAPAPAPMPAPSDPAAALPATEILIPVGPVRPIGGTTSIPVPPGAGDTPVPDAIPIEVIVEELPPADAAPPTDPADVPITVVQDPAPEIPGPPADATADPNAAPDASAPADVAVVASYDGTGGTAASGT